MSPHEIGNFSTSGMCVMWRMPPQCKSHAFCCNLRTFVAKSVLSQFTTFVWRKIEPKIACVEKKLQISGMGGGLRRRLKYRAESAKIV